MRICWSFEGATVIFFCSRGELWVMGLSFEGGRGGRVWVVEVYRDPSTAFGAKYAPNSAQDDSAKQTTAKNRQQQKQIPPLCCGMTSKNRNDKQEQATAQYGDSGCARMTTRGDCA